MGNGLQIARDAAAASRSKKITPSQKAVLEFIKTHPGELAVDANPNTLAACKTKGWIQSEEANPDPLKKAKWWITRSGEFALEKMSLTL